MHDYQLQAALENPESDVAIPGTRRLTSMISQIAGMKVGECVTRTMEIQGDVTLVDVQQNLSAWKRGMASSLSSSVKHAKERIGHGKAQFSVETTHNLTSTGRLYIMAIVTRTDNE